MVFSIVELILISHASCSNFLWTCTPNVLLLNEIVATFGLSVHGFAGIVISSGGGGCYAKSAINRVSYLANMYG